MAVRDDRLDLQRGRAAGSRGQPLSRPGPRSVRVALRRADGHALAAGDLLEAEVERVLEHDDRRLRGRDLRQAGAERGAQLEASAARAGSPSRASRDPLRTARSAAPADVARRRDTRCGQAVEPGREGRLAAKLAELRRDGRARPATRRAHPPRRGAGGARAAPRAARDARTAPRARACRRLSLSSPGSGRSASRSAAARRAGALERLDASGARAVAPAECRGWRR